MAANVFSMQVRLLQAPRDFCVYRFEMEGDTLTVRVMNMACELFYEKVISRRDFASDTELLRCKFGYVRLLEKLGKAALFPTVFVPVATPEGSHASSTDTRERLPVIDASILPDVERLSEEGKIQKYREFLCNFPHYLQGYELLANLLRDTGDKKHVLLSGASFAMQIGNNSGAVELFEAASRWRDLSFGDYQLWMQALINQGDYGQAIAKGWKAMSTFKAGRQYASIVKMAAWLKALIKKQGKDLTALEDVQESARRAKARSDLVVFGPDAWRELFKAASSKGVTLSLDIEKVLSGAPPLPDLRGILRAPCPYNKRKTMAQTHRLVLVLGLTFKEFIQFLLSPEHIDPTVVSRLKNVEVRRPYWVFIAACPQLRENATGAKEAKQLLRAPYRMPTPLEALITFAMEKRVRGLGRFQKYTWCEYFTPSREYCVVGKNEGEKYPIRAIPGYSDEDFGVMPVWELKGAFKEDNQEEEGTGDQRQVSTRGQAKGSPGLSGSEGKSSEE